MQVDLLDGKTRKITLQIFLTTISTTIRAKNWIKMVSMRSNERWCWQTTQSALLMVIGQCVFFGKQNKSVAHSIIWRQMKNENTSLIQLWCRLVHWIAYGWHNLQSCKHLFHYQDIKDWKCGIRENVKKFIGHGGKALFVLCVFMYMTGVIAKFSCPFPIDLSISS